MPPAKELCRNFQRGSCQYGDRCKFLHATPQQSKTNPFGFGARTGTPFHLTDQQQQMPNPFGFGIQNNKARGGNDFGSKPNQFKPFENKWTRSSSANASSASVPRQSDSQPQAANHKCTDPESCKRIMVGDFENEKPQWKLTCYSHIGNGPCDIVGDISCEELRAFAYDDAKRGLSLQSIIDRERSLVNSKLVEFQNLVRKPYTISSNATPSTQSPFAGTSSNTHNIGSAVSPSVSSFSQLNASLNARSATVPNYTFGRASPLQSNTQASSMFQTSKSPFNSSASSSNNEMNANRNPFSTVANSSPMPTMTDNYTKTFTNEPIVASSATGQSSISIHDNMSKENANVDDSIWKKVEWKLGEIPEEEPPSNCIY